MKNAKHGVINNSKVKIRLVVSNIEILAKTEYQDIYRVADGVLLVVNKFLPIFKDNIVRVYDEGRQKCYGSGTQKQLCILKKDHTDWNNIFVPKGTVTYINVPVVSTTNKNEWEFQVKTTGECFSGDINRMQELLSSILKQIREGY